VSFVLRSVLLAPRRARRETSIEAKQTERRRAASGTGQRNELNRDASSSRRGPIGSCKTSRVARRPSLRALSLAAPKRLRAGFDLWSSRSSLAGLRAPFGWPRGVGPLESQTATLPPVLRRTNAPSRKVGKTTTTGQQSLTYTSGGESRTLFASQFTILIDRSGSMNKETGDGTRMDVAREAFVTFVKKVTHKGDRVCLFAYNEEPTFVLSEPAHKIDLKDKKLQDKLTAKGLTNMPLAIERAIENMKKYNEDSKKKMNGKVVNWLVVFTDGDATQAHGTQHTTEDVLNNIRAASKTVWNFKMCFIGVGQTPTEEAVLKKMAGTVKRRLNTDGGLVLSTEGTDAKSLRKVIEDASTRIVNLNSSIKIDNGDGQFVNIEGTQAAVRQVGRSLALTSLGIDFLGSTQRPGIADPPSNPRSRGRSSPPPRRGTGGPR